MPPKQTFSKEAILKAALEVIRKSGFSNLSARTIADELHSSTMPIYSYLKSMTEITDELRNMAFNCITDYQVKKYTDNPLLNMAIGYIAFAREEKKLFRFIFVESALELDWDSWDAQKQLQDLAFHKLGILDSTEMLTKDIPAEILQSLTQKSWIFTHGLALLINSGMFKNMSDQAIREMIEDNSSAVYHWEMQKLSMGSAVKNKGGNHEKFN